MKKKSRASTRAAFQLRVKISVIKLQRFASCAALCLAPLLLTACNSAQVATPVSAAPIPNEVHQLKNGLRVEMIPFQNGDLADLVEAKIWKFRVSSDNKTNRILVSSVKILRYGKVVQIVGRSDANSFFSGYETNPFDGTAAEVSVAMMPLDDGSWSDAKFVKINVRLRDGGRSTIFANPFRAYSDLVTTSGFQSNDTILLMAGSGKNQSNVSPSSTTNPVSLVLSFTTRPIKHKSQ